MGGPKSPEMMLQGFERVFFDKLRLAASVILDSARDLDFVTGPLEVELEAFKDQVEHMLLLPDALSDASRGKAFNDDSPGIDLPPLGRQVTQSHGLGNADAAGRPERKC